MRSIFVFETRVCKLRVIFRSRLLQCSLRVLYGLMKACSSVISHYRNNRGIGYTRRADHDLYHNRSSRS